MFNNNIYTSLSERSEGSTLIRFKLRGPRDGIRAAVGEAARVCGPVGSRSIGRSGRGSVLPAVLLQHVRQFDDELALLILLRQFEGVLVLPAQCGLAALAENVGHGMQSGEEDSLLRRAAGHIDDGVEEVRATLTALKGLADQFVVAGQMRAAVDAAVCPVTVVQVGLKRLTHGYVHGQGSQRVR